MNQPQYEWFYSFPKWTFHLFQHILNWFENIKKLRSVVVPIFDEKIKIANIVKINTSSKFPCLQYMIFSINHTFSRLNFPYNFNLVWSCFIKTIQTVPKISFSPKIPLIHKWIWTIVIIIIVYCSGRLLPAIVQWKLHSEELHGWNV